MRSFGASEQCEIHEQWLYLLRLYTAGSLSSQSYVEQALAALQAGKDQLRRRIPLQAQVTPGAKKSKKPKKKKTKKRRDTGLSE